MSRVIHIGAAQGEVEYYASMGVQELVYVEPDLDCLRDLSANIKACINSGREMKITVIPRACSSISGQTKRFYANGEGQSSFHKPGKRTEELAVVGFTEYNVKTITLTEIIDQVTEGRQFVDYLCIDTQGHEVEIICSTAPEFLSERVGIVDVELMTDTNQYEIERDGWKKVVTHLNRSGFRAVVIPHGVTESYMFVNMALDNAIVESLRLMMVKIKEDLIRRSLSINNASVSSIDIRSAEEAGDMMWLPMGMVEGGIHASLLEEFRLELTRRYFKILKLIC